MHHSFIKALYFSYEILPIGQFNFSGGIVSYTIDLMQSMFLLAFKFASPIIATMLILDVGLGVLVRAVPQMNVFVVGFPLKIAMFLLVMIFATDLVIDNYAIIYASAYGHTEVVKLLLEAGADVTFEDNYAIEWASVNGHTEIVKLLIEAGADVTAWNNYAIEWAFSYGHAEVVKLLIEAGADASVCKN